jgi:hypothetical protein
MLTDLDLKNKQDTFIPYKNGNWYDGLWDFELTKDKNGSYILSHHSEVDGTTEYINHPTSLDDLANTYELLSYKQFNLK